MRSALMDANGLPLTMMVYVSSLSVDIRLPNQDLLVSSGDGSGVGLWFISSTGRERKNILFGFTQVTEILFTLQLSSVKSR